jgi:flagellar motility protein MotE (MotC chaperone)
MPVRILLVTVFAAAFMLTVRLADLWQGLAQVFDSVSIGSRAAAADAAKPDAKPEAIAKPAEAGKAAEPVKLQPEEAAKPEANAKPAEAGKAAPAENAKPGAKADSEAKKEPGANAESDASTELRPPLVDAEKPADGESAKAPKAKNSARPEPDEGYSDAEIAALQSLAQRREELDGREKALDTREGLLAAGEKRVDQKIAEMKDIQGKIQGLLKTYGDQETAKLKSLVKIYENMKPKDAAPIFEQLEMDILLDVVERMKEAKFAPILAQMNPAKAKEITGELARRRQLSQAVSAGTP